MYRPMPMADGMYVDQYGRRIAAWSQLMYNSGATVPQEVRAHVDGQERYQTQPRVAESVPRARPSAKRTGSTGPSCAPLPKQPRHDNHTPSPPKSVREMATQTDVSGPVIDASVAAKEVQKARDEAAAAARDFSTDELVGAHWHYRNGKTKPLEKSHWVTKVKKRPESAYWAPEGFKEVKLSTNSASHRYGDALHKQLAYQIPLRAPDAAIEEEEEDEDALDHGTALRVQHAAWKVEFTVNEEQRNHLLALAMESEALGNEKTVGDGDEKFKIKAYDISAACRMIANGDAAPGTAIRTAFRSLQDKLYSLRTQLAYERGWTNWKAGKVTFEAPSKSQSKKDNRASRRTLQQVDAHLWAIWHMVDPPDSTEVTGLENLFACLAERSMPKSGCFHSQKWFTKRLADLLWQQTRLRGRFEILRRKTHLWAPSDFRSAFRKGHCGARSISVHRQFGSGQYWANDRLLQAGRDAVEYAGLWVRMGRYRKDLSEAEIDAERQRRREENDAPSKKVVEEFMQEAFESTTEHLPTRKHDTRHSLKSVCVAIDEDIGAGRVITWDLYVAYWRRYMAASRYFCKLRGLARAKKRPIFYVALLEEHNMYYMQRRPSPAPMSDLAWQKLVQSMGKKAYHLRAQRESMDKEGNVRGGRQLVYQRISAAHFSTK